ncbi:MAG: sodium-dependent bicarbonate transport family permease [Rhodocyclaceae bacterium]|nr:sodium-dependent bicarbonate transport family permease [Rhodocyclaceae bacterium]
MSDPVILFFILGLIAGLSRSDLKIPGVLYESLSIFLLLAIGLKGGAALAQNNPSALLVPILVVTFTAMLVPVLAFLIAHYVGGYERADAGSLAAHYGSVSVVTFAVGSSYLTRLSVPFEGFMSVFLVILEIPGLLIGVALARWSAGDTRWGVLMHEILAGKSIVLLVGGLMIGYVSGEQGLASISPVFFTLFKGLLAIFLLEMGLVTAGRVADLKKSGIFLISFGVIMPLISAAIGIVTASLLGLSVGGATLLATLFASASYIAAPAAIRMAVPEANPSLSIGASLGITFPFNITVGIPLYYAASQWLLGASL